MVIHLLSPISAKAAEDTGVFIRDVLAAAPGVPVQVAHMAGGGPYDDATNAAMQAFVDAFADGTLERDRITFATSC